jgi:hypothetical protein
MKWSFLVVLVLGVLLIAGCQRGDIRISAVVEGQRAPHAGWNFGPDSYLEEGDTVKVTGVDLWMKGFDPNDF